MSCVAHSFNPRTQEAQAGGSVCVRGQTALHGEFQDSQSHIVRKNKNKSTKKLIVGDHGLYFLPSLIIGFSSVISFLRVLLCGRMDELVCESEGKKAKGPSSLSFGMGCHQKVLPRERMNLPASSGPVMKIPHWEGPAAWVLVETRCSQVDRLFVVCGGCSCLST